MVLAVASQLKQNLSKKNLWNHYFSAGIWFSLLSNKHQLLHKKQRTLIGPIDDFVAHKMFLFQELIGDVQKPLFFCKF